MTAMAAKKDPYLLLMLVSVIALFLFFALNLLFGSVWIPPADILDVLLKQQSGNESSTALIIYSLRIPMAITAMLSGAGLALAGLLMQTLFRNPLADPSILGISSGASLGVALMLAFAGSMGGLTMANYGLWGHVGITLSAFAGAFLVLLLITFLSRRMGSIISLLIIGIMIGYIAGALTGFVKYYSQKEEVHSFVLWGLGSFANVGQDQLPIYAVLILPAMLLAWLMAKPLNLLLLGERYAANLGLNINRNQLLIILIAGYLTALVTAYAGPIAFIGLAVPHLARNLLNTADHRRLLPAVVILGANLALFCNLIARMPGFDGSLPINAVTSLFGAPVVIWIILYRRQLYTNNA